MKLLVALLRQRGDATPGDVAGELKMTRTDACDLLEEGVNAGLVEMLPPDPETGRLSERYRAAPRRRRAQRPAATADTPGDGTSEPSRSQVACGAPAPERSAAA